MSHGIGHDHRGTVKLRQSEIYFFFVSIYFYPNLRGAVPRVRPWAHLGWFLKCAVEYFSPNLLFPKVSFVKKKAKS
jgi:hypothetical protein